jgi:SAM-dependent methyltransferase
MKLVRRICPLCASTEHQQIMVLRQDDFTMPNSTYHLERLDELGLDPAQLYPIVKCRHCSMIYSLYHLDDEIEALVYNWIIDPETSLEKALTVSRRRKDLKRWLGLLSLVEESNPGRINLKVMDYGCGFGTLLLVAQGPGVQVVGFDVTEWKVGWAREQGLTICESVKELEAYAPFDLCISTSVLEHLRFPRKAVAEMASLLKPNGYALITCVVAPVAGEAGWNEIKRRLLNGQPIPKEINPWEHLNYFTAETLSTLLSEFGFVPVPTQAQPGDLRGLLQNIKRSWKSGGIGLRPIARYLRYRGTRRVGKPRSQVSEYWHFKDW